MNSNIDYRSHGVPLETYELIGKIANVGGRAEGHPAELVKPGGVVPVWV